AARCRRRTRTTNMETTMRCTLRAVLIAVCLLPGVSRSEAATIGVQPSATGVSVGSLVDLRLVVSGLRSGSAPSLSAFDVDVAFAGDLLAFDPVTFGDPDLGDQLDLSGFGSLTLAIPGPGVVTLVGVSFDAPLDLDASQADTFVLATLAFRALGAGLAPVGISGAALADAVGDALPPLVAPAATIEVTSASVPEPASLLFALTVAAVIASRRRR